MSKTPTGSTTPAAGSTRASAFALVAILVVRWYTQHVDHLSLQERVLAVAAVTWAINQAVTLIENRSGKGLLRDPVTQPQDEQAAWPPGDLVVRLHPDDIAAIAAAGSARKRTERGALSPEFRFIILLVTVVFIVIIVSTALISALHGG
jgi:hypothetical protein